MSKGQNPPGIERRRFRPYPRYKDSGVEWLGKIPAHWDITRIKEQFCIVNGSTPSSSDPSFWDGDIVWVTPDDLGELHVSQLGDSSRKITEEGYKSCGTSIVPKGSIVVSTRAPIGYVAIATTNLCTNQGCKSLVPKRPLSTGFFYYQLSSAKNELKSRGEGSTFKEISKDKLGLIILTKPPEPDQHPIAFFLDRETAKINTLIEKKERLIELLQEKRTALITQAVTRGLDPAVPMKDSGVEWLGEIPAHWVVESNKRLFKDSNIRSDYGDEELLTVSHLTGVTWHSEKNVTMIEPESYEDYKICRAGELAINTMWAWMGALGIAKENGIVSPSYNVYALRTSSLDPRYYEYLCRTSLHIAELTRYSKGIWKSRLRLYPDGFYEISTPLPPITEQEQIADFVDSAVLKVDAMVMATRKAVDRLREYRTALISAAVTGKIDVREA